MGNLCKTCKLRNKERKNITILLAGLDNAGKTTVAKKLAGEPTNSVLPTIGFSLVTLHYGGYKLTLYDLGGSSNIRDIWNKYYMDAHGIIYVVDASDSTRFEESKRIFTNILSHENISGKHVLLLAHKQDKENALDELEIVEQLNLEYIVNKYKCPTRVEATSVFGFENSKIDEGLKYGFRWIVDNIIQNYKIINDRVQCDMVNYALLVENDREKWRNRMKSKIDSTEETDIEENGNPFQPINSIIVNAQKDASRTENGTSRRPLMIDNFIENEQTKPELTQKAVNNVSHSLITAVTEPFQAQKIKLKKQYYKHKKKFGRFNKTAPIPIDEMISGKSLVNENTVKKPERNHALISSGNDLEKIAETPKNYLIRRPATAPSKFNLTKSKEKAWNLSAPLDSSRSTQFTDEGDISFFRTINFQITTKERY